MILHCLDEEIVLAVIDATIVVAVLTVICDIFWNVVNYFFGNNPPQAQPPQPPVLAAGFRDK